MYGLSDLFTFYCFGALVSFVAMLINRNEQEKEDFRRYEQKRRAYTADRLRRIERGEL